MSSENQRCSIQTKYAATKTTFVYLWNITFGLSMSLIGPSIPDLCDRMNMTAEQMGEAIALAGVVSTVVAVFSGTLLDRYQRHMDLILGLTLSCIGVATILIPYAPSYLIFVLLQMLFWTGIVAYDQAANVMMFSIWGERSTPAIQGLHACWGVGFCVGPLILRPYLGPDTHLLPTPATGANSSDMTTRSTIATSASFLNQTQADDFMEVSRIEVPYTIIAIMVFASSLCAFISYNIKIPRGVKFHLKAAESFRKLFSCAEGDEERASSSTIALLVLFSFYYFFNCGREGTFSTWIFKYAIDSGLDFTKKEAALLDSAAQFSFLAGRILATVATVKCAIQPLLFFEAYAVLAITLCLLFLGTQQKVMLWVFSCLFQLCSSPMWPGGLAWTNRYLTVSGRTMILLNLGAGVANVLFPYLAGWIFTYHSPYEVMYLLVICQSVLCAQLILMQIIAYRKGVRFSNAPEEISIDEVNFVEYEEH